MAVKLLDQEINESRECPRISNIKTGIKIVVWIRNTLLDAIRLTIREGIGRKVGIRVIIWTYLPTKEEKDG